MITSKHEDLQISDPIRAWQDPFYFSRIKNMTPFELAATKAVEKYAIRNGKADQDLNEIHNKLWSHWKYSTPTVKANRHELDLLNEFANWLNLSS